MNIVVCFAKMYFLPYPPPIGLVSRKNSEKLFCVFVLLHTLQNPYPVYDCGVRQLVNPAINGLRIYLPQHLIFYEWENVNFDVMRRWN